MMRNRCGMNLLKGAALLAMISNAHAAGFGTRKGEPAPAPTEVAATKPATPKAVAFKTPQPPKEEGVEYVRVPFEKAENEVLALLARDLVNVEEVAKELALYEVRVTGNLMPQSYGQTLRGKIEKTILTSPKLKIKECRQCSEARLVRTENGEIRYESYSNDRTRPGKIAGEIGVDSLMVAEMNYSPEDLKLRVRVIEGATGDIKWTKEYSTADVVKTRERLNQTGSGSELGEGESLSRVIIGEVAFTMVVSPGMTLLQTIDQGGGSSFTTYPSADLFIGEKFDRARKVFGFNMGGAFMFGSAPELGQPLPWMVKFGPTFKYFFNPYSMSIPRFSANAEAGGMISSGLVTGYVGLGPEMSMINRFSLTAMPIYIFKTTVADAENLVEMPDGTFEDVGSGDIGKFGGLAFVLKMNINW